MVQALRATSLAVAITAVVAVSLGGCGGQEESAPTSAPTSTPTLASTPVLTLAPTAVPTLAPTPTPTAAPTPTPTAAPVDLPRYPPPPGPIVQPIPAFEPRLSEEFGVDPAEYAGWGEVEGDTLCFDSELEFDGTVLAAGWPARSFEALLERVGGRLAVVDAGAPCSATITLRLSGQSVSAEYPGCDPSTRYTGAKGEGTVTLTANGFSPLTIAVSPVKSPDPSVLCHMAASEPHTGDFGRVVESALSTAGSALGLVPDCVTRLGNKAFCRCIDPSEEFSRWCLEEVVGYLRPPRGDYDPLNLLSR